MHPLCQKSEPMSREKFICLLPSDTMKAAALDQRTNSRPYKRTAQTRNQHMQAAEVGLRMCSVLQDYSLGFASETSSNVGNSLATGHNFSLQSCILSS